MMIKHLFDNGYILKQMNKTLITLIPKIDCPATFKDFRPISLCNTAYKAISKVLVLRMQNVMKEVISPNQHAFVKERLISDSVLLTAEMMTYWHW